MSIIVKCKNCNGTGYIPMGHGIRGLAVCKVCDGVGTYENDEIIFVNNEPFYRILNGTSYDYAPIPKEFKPYFEKLQQENQQLKKELKATKEVVEEHLKKEIQLKEVIEEIRKTLKLERKTALSLNQAYTVSVIDSVLQILDKGESNE